MELHVHVIYMYMYVYVQSRKKSLELAPKEKKETKKSDINFFNFSTHLGADTHNHCHIDRNSAQEHDCGS